MNGPRRVSSLSFFLRSQEEGEGEEEEEGENGQKGEREGERERAAGSELLPNNSVIKATYRL